MKRFDREFEAATDEMIAANNRPPRLRDKVLGLAWFYGLLAVSVFVLTSLVRWAWKALSGS